MVFYRKYRPQTIEEIDSKDVRDTLYAVLRHKDIAHAFLFTGPKGLGKTSTARIVAKAVNCEKSSNLKAQISKPHLKSQNLETKNQIEPCNKCDQCISITNGTNIDVLEIDGASNRGIDEIRDLREKVGLSAARASKKVYIIDEVHMLTQEAFNALLKTLEEPPSHVIFILCTTEPHKLPQTIVSRCMHVSFKKAGVEELVRSFKRIAKKENIDIDDKTLSLVATLSDGSFRDGAKILEEIVLASLGNKITKETIEQKYQVSSIKYQVSQMTEFLSEKNTVGGLQLISKLVEQGVDMRYFIENLVSELHAILLIKVGVVDKEQKIESRGWKIEDISELVRLLVRAYGELKYAVLPQLPLEMVIVEWGEPQILDALTPLACQNDVKRVRHSGDDPPTGGEDSRISGQETRQTRQAIMTGNTNDFWQELIDKIKLQNQSIAAVLRGCALKEYDGKSLVIETKYKFHKDRLDNIKTLALIEKICEEIAKNKIKASILLKSA